MGNLIHLKAYIEKQIKYCEEMAGKEEYKVSNYSSDMKMTNEQMSGYYQGKAEAFWAIFYRIKEVKQTKED